MKRQNCLICCSCYWVSEMSPIQMGFIKILVYIYIYIYTYVQEKWVIPTMHGRRKQNCIGKAKTTPIWCVQIHYHFFFVTATVFMSPED